MYIVIGCIFCLSSCAYVYACEIWNSELISRVEYLKCISKVKSHINNSSTQPSLPFPQFNDKSFFLLYYNFITHQLVVFKEFIVYL